MKHHHQFSILNYLLTAMICAGLTAQVFAAEIILKSDPVSPLDSLMTLGDVADIRAVNAADNIEALKQTILFPAPTESELTLTLKELRNTLSQLGIDSVNHQIGGANKVMIRPRQMTAMMIPQITQETQQKHFVQQANYIENKDIGDQVNSHFSETSSIPAPTVSSISPKVEAGFMKILEQQVGDALKVYLNFTNQINRSWEVSLKLTPDQVRLLASNGQIKEISGGNIPFTGIQQFSIRMQTNVVVSVEATVVLPTEIVVLRRSVPKGHIITASDVMLKKVDKVRGEDFMMDINDAVGKETVKAIMEMNPLTAGLLRLPLMVRQGEIVTVRAAGRGVVVRTEATALQDGVLGDTISVERIDGTPRGLTPKAKGKRKPEEAITYLVRVCAPKTVEIFAN